MNNCYIDNFKRNVYAKRTCLLALSFCAAISISAQSALDLQSKAQLRQKRLELKHQQPDNAPARISKLKNIMGVPAGHTIGMIKLKDGMTAGMLEDEGVNVLRSRYGFVFVSLPIDDVERVAALKGVERLQLARPVAKKMDRARAAAGVDMIHQGLDLPQAYTGKGVICGIMDNGFDPNHISFRDAAGKSRIGQLDHFAISSDGMSVTRKVYNRDDISSFTTDTESNYHGTHTMGIMAGGYKGISEIATATAGTGTTATIGEQANPFYGVAYDADIVAVCGDLWDMIIAMGVESMIDYAYTERKPLVINLSLGSNSGAHDGKSMINQFFDACAEEANAIICMAAGNEGSSKIALNKTFTADDNELKTFIAGQKYNIEGDMIYARTGSITIYSNDEKPLRSIQAVIYNKNRGKISFRFPITISEETQGTGKYWVSSSGFQQESTDIISTEFGKYFNGYVGIGWDIDTDNNRFYALIDYYAENSDDNAEGDYLLGFIVNGDEGQRADCFCDGLYSWLSDDGVEGWDDGMNDGSISDLATGNSTLVIGAYNTRDSWGALDGLVYQPEIDVPTGEITSFSSYGTLVDGRTLPHVCAPGTAIISAISSYYAEGGYASDGALCARTTETGRTDYWGWSMGTSMATPFVTGSIALWLEADPTLTINDIKDIVATTAVKDEAVLNANPVQAGAGKFDAYAGLKEVIRRGGTGIGSVSGNTVHPVITASGDRAFKVFVGGARSLDITILNLAGTPVRMLSAQGDEATVDVSSLAGGVYILKVNGCQSQRIIVR